MKKLFLNLFMLAVFSIVYTSCEDLFSDEDVNHQIVWESVPENELNSVKAWYQSTDVSNEDMEIAWGTAQYCRVKDGKYIVSALALGKDVETLKTIYFHKTEDGFTSYFLGIKPGDDGISKDGFSVDEGFSGEISLFDLEDNLKASSVLENGEAIRVKNIKDKGVISNLRTAISENNVIVLDEIVITGTRIQYNTVWITFYTPSYYDMSDLFPGYRYEGTAGGGRYNYSAPVSKISESPLVLGDGNIPPPIDIECVKNVFLNDNKSILKYEMTIYVDQPKAGTREPWKVVDDNGNKFSAGHTFIGLTKINADGTKLEYIVGYYPITGNINPLEGDFTDKGGFRDNNYSSYDVSISWKVSGPEFINALLYLEGFKGSTYNLNTQNCTDIAVTCADMAGRLLPDTPGKWSGGGGTNPADLGEDIRAMPNSRAYTINRNGGTARTSYPSNPC